MELRVDRLLAKLKHSADDILRAIDTDPLLMKREINGLTLANATKELFTPTEEHHLYAKGIVYARSPYRLISLPLLKIYNLGERNVTVHDLTALAEEGAQIRFLRKFDGSMVQRFQHDGQVYFTTRGMIEGVYLEHVEAETHFDYLQAARLIAQTKYPQLLDAKPEWEGLTFVMELIHPDARVITDYGPRTDLVLLAVFDRNSHHYWGYQQLHFFASEHQLCVTDQLEYNADSLQGQIDAMLSAIQESDQEGSVINFEVDHQVVYRVKVKSPSYLRLMRLMVNCTEANTVAMLNAFSEYPTWPVFEEFLKQQGAESVPEEVLNVYKEFFDRHYEFRRVATEIYEYVEQQTRQFLNAIQESEPRAKRRLLAQNIQFHRFRPLIFTAADGRLNLTKTMEFLENYENAIQERNGLN